MKNTSRSIESEAVNGNESGPESGDLGQDRTPRSLKASAGIAASSSATGSRNKTALPETASEAKTDRKSSVQTSSNPASGKHHDDAVAPAPARSWPFAAGSQGNNKPLAAKPVQRAGWNARQFRI